MTRLQVELQLASDKPVSRKDFMKLLKLSPYQADDDVRTLYSKDLVDLSGPTDERELVKAREMLSIEELNRLFQKGKIEKVPDDEVHPWELEVF